MNIADRNMTFDWQSGASGRYAIYFMPEPTSDLWAFGSRTLGYDAAQGEDVAYPEPCTLSAVDQVPNWKAWSEIPRKYGFHATLKAPFTLRPDASESDLRHQIETLCDVTPAIEVGRLRVAPVGRFVALVPVHTSSKINIIADACTRCCEDARLPLSQADRERRLASGLTQRQANYMDTWGYPYVFDEFKFHMTLTGRLEPAEQGLAIEQLTALYTDIDQPVSLDALTLAFQPNRDRPFKALHRFPLRGSDS